MINIAVVGSRKYRNRDIMERKLEEEILPYFKKKEAIIISGRCSMIGSVDNWAIAFAKKHGYTPREFPPEDMTTQAFFDRNELVARHADILLAFINRFQYRSGAWNTIRYFRAYDGKAYRFGDQTGYYKVFDENGVMWDRSWK